MPLPAVHSVLSDRPVFLASGHWMSKNMQQLVFLLCLRLAVSFLPQQFLSGNQPAGRSLITELA